MKVEDCELWEVRETRERTAIVAIIVMICVRGVYEYIVYYTMHTTAVHPCRECGGGRADGRTGRYV